jgi:hypothetical protein
MEMQRFNRNFLTVGSGIILAVVMFLPAGPGRAAGNGDGTAAFGVVTAPPETAAPAPVAAQGMRVYRDPQTGRLGPPPAGVQPPGLSVAEQRMLNRSDAGLQPRALPGGGVAVDLQGRYQSMAVATVGADGQAAVNCADTQAQAEAVLQAGQQVGGGAAH